MKPLTAISFITVFSICAACGSPGTPAGDQSVESSDDERSVSEQNSSDLASDGAVTDGDEHPEFAISDKLSDNLSAVTNAYIDDMSMSDEEYLKQAEIIKSECLNNVETITVMNEIDTLVAQSINDKMKKYIDAVFKSTADIASTLKEVEQNEMSRENFQTDVAAPALESVKNSRFMVKKMQDDYSYLFGEYNYLFNLTGDYETNINALIERASK
ncbi:MAG: hypothetical protein LBL35_07050 [Clostridiales bacterium]|jgi:hypothetical protein|nr:hypothetical protein [Clostridiales bacterium]